MSEYGKDERIKYLEAIIEDLMKNNRISRIEDFTRVKYCHYCYKQLENENPPERSLLMYLIQGIIYGTLLLVFLILAAIIFGILTY